MSNQVARPPEFDKYMIDEFGVEPTDEYAGDFSVVSLLEMWNAASAKTAIPPNCAVCNVSDLERFIHAAWEGQLQGEYIESVSAELLRAVKYAKEKAALCTDDVAAVRAEATDFGMARIGIGRVKIPNQRDIQRLRGFGTT